jgi:hypothetical protein
VDVDGFPSAALLIKEILWCSKSWRALSMIRKERELEWESAVGKRIGDLHKVERVKDSDLMAFGDTNREIGKTNGYFAVVHDEVVRSGLWIIEKQKYQDVV